MVAQITRVLAMFAGAVLLSACGDDSPSAAGAITPGEAEALNNAAEMLDESNQPKPGEAPKDVEEKGE